MPKIKSLYSVHPGVLMVQKWIETLPEKTGRSLDEWLFLLEREGPPTAQERRDWLKTQYKLGTNSAWWLAERSVGKGTEEDSPETYLQTAEQYVADMFAGPKAGLRPLYDALLHFGLSFAPDVKACPCKTIVPLYRNHVIAQIKPATRTRIDFGFALGATKAAGRLIDTGGFAKKDRITHRIEIKALSDIDAEVKQWFQVAYERDAE
jgi:hypothetical protein